MSEEREIKEARKLIAENNFDEASKILWKLYQSNNKKIKLDSILALLVVLDRFTKNEKLLEIVNAGLAILPKTNDSGTKVYLMTEKCSMLLTELNLMLYRQKNLKLSANVYRWINFSTEREKNEFELIEQEKQKIIKELNKLEKAILNYLCSSNDYYSKGNIFMKLGDCYSQKLSNVQFDVMIGGKTRCKLGNIYFIKRWKLDRWIMYNRKGRIKIKSTWEKSVHYYHMAIAEFNVGEKYGMAGYAYCNLALQYKMIFRFAKAKKLLAKAEQLAIKYDDALLSSKTALLKKALAEKNKNIKNYVEEYGLDLP